jgi:hypothetical protein
MSEDIGEEGDNKNGDELLREWIATANNQVEVLPKESEDNWLDFGERSVLGAVQRETGGILVDGGWLRILGSGHAKLSRTLFDWNLGRTTPHRSIVPRLLLIADDVVGGFYAVNWGGLPEPNGAIYYFAPDSLSWEPMEDFQYAQFIWWALNGDVEGFYESLRWPNWQAEVASVLGDQALSIVPPLWTDAGKEIANTSRRPVPVSEVFGLNVISYPRQLGDAIPECLLC